MLIKTQKVGTRKNGNSEKTHCSNGHMFTEETTYISPKSQKRSCRICTTNRVSRIYLSDIVNKRTSNAAHMRQWRANNRERNNKSWTDLRKNKVAYINSKKTACTKCGCDDPACLDFHHRNHADKITEVSLAAARWSIKRIQEEIDKCDVLCSNCHRKLHAAERAAEKVS